LKSEAFRGLGKWSMLVLLDFMGKRKMKEFKIPGGRGSEWRITNNGELVYTYAEAERKGISKAQFRDAIDQLMERGFLDITHRGSGGRKGDKNLYSLESRWKDFGTPNFQPVKPRVRDTRGGRGWSAFHKKKKRSSVSKTIPKNENLGKEKHTRNKPGQAASSTENNTPSESDISLTL